MSIVIENGDKIRGDATSASEVDFTIYGIDDDTRKQLADGQLANSIGDLYTADSTDVVSSVIYVNTGAAHNHVNLYLTPSAGTARRLIPKDLQLEVGYCLIFDGQRVMVLDTNGGLVSGTNVSDVAYAATWDGVTTVAPSKNTVYDALLATLLTAAGDMVYASAANVLARLAKGSANTKLFMNAGATAPEWVSGIKTGAFTRLLNTGTGDLSYTGVGFKPSYIIFISSLPFGCLTIGFDDGAAPYAANVYASSSYAFGSTYSIEVVNTGATAYQLGKIKSFDSDGFTITWTATGSEGSTGSIAYMAFR